MAVRELEARVLFRRCDPQQFSFETTDELEPLSEVLGQPRAVEALRFGIEVGRDGYNIFAFGPPGTGKQNVVLHLLRERAAREPAPDDWCYVNDFAQPHKPRALALPAGKGRQLRRDMEQLIEEAHAALSAAFEGDEFRLRQQELEQAFSEQQKEALEQLRSVAHGRGLTVMLTPQGLAIMPKGENGKPMPPQDIQQLSEERRNELEEEAKKLQKEAQRLFQHAPRAQREARQRLRELKREVARRALQPLFDELRQTYAGLLSVLEFFDAVAADLIDHGEEFLHVQQAQKDLTFDSQWMSGLGGPLQLPLPRALSESPLMRRYRVNVLVEHDPAGGAPLVHEDHPTYPNLVGRVDHWVQMGMLVADFNLIQPGALHRANGGYLVLDVFKLLSLPQAWEALKRCLLSREIRIESLGEALGLVHIVSLEPQPIPLEVKLVLLGTPQLYRLLTQLDPDVPKLFKVPADFGSDMDRDEQSQHLYARLIGTLAKDHGLRPLDRGAVARVIERSSRLSGNAGKLTVHLESIADLLQEASYWAGQAGSTVVRGEHVQQAIDARIFRSDRLRELVREEILRGTILIASQGRQVGQVNGLAVVSLGDFSFGRPTRITARTRIGKGEVVDIEREVELGGPLHSKGVLILASFISGRYARELPLTLSASLVFEQSYTQVEGDSASLAELCALLSSIADLPLKQTLAVTGSVDQLGQVQPIGEVNEKVEGFFDICRERGLDGEHGVIIPAANVQHLMLRGDVVRAVQEGYFHLYAVQTSDQAMELLAGQPMGEPDEQGRFPPESVNGRIQARLEELARRRQEERAQERAQGRD